LPDTLFTVITVVRNAELLISGTLNSILEQTYSNFELIIVDGGSTDSTLTKVNEILSSTSVVTQVISEPDDGIYDAMNKGIKAASGAYTIFINAGDSLCSNDTLLNVAARVHQHQACDVYFGDSFVSFGEYKNFLKAGKVENLRFGMQFSHQAVFVATSLLKRHLFNTKFRIASDFDFLLSLLEHGHSFLYLQMPVAITLHGGISDAKRMRTYYEYLRIVNQHKFKVKPSFIIALKMFFDLFKKPIKFLISPSQFMAIRKFFT